MGTSLTRLVELADRPMSETDCAWLTSSVGLLVACQEIVTDHAAVAVDRLESSKLWFRVLDVTPYELGPSLVRRAKLILAATKVALSDGMTDAAHRASGALVERFCDDLAFDNHDPVSARWVVDDLVTWLRGVRPAPVAVRRVTFLVDQHSHGRAVRLTFAQFPQSGAFAPDLISNPFTIIDADFRRALGAARTAIGHHAEGVRWSATWETGEVPLELNGGSVGLAALVCLDRLNTGLTIGSETSWVFTGGVDATGSVIGCAVPGFERSYANKLIAANRRHIVVAAADLELAERIVDASGIVVELHAASTLADVVALLDARKPTWMSDHGSTVVGRVDEIGNLLAAAESASAGVTFQCVTGEPGIGKSRLTREVARRLADLGWQIAWGTCFEAEATADFRAAVAVLRSLLATHDLAESLPLDDRNEISMLVPEVARGTVSSAPAGVEVERQLLLFDAVARLVRRVAELRPLAIFIDDIHWADRSTLLMLSHLARHLADRSVLVIVSCRDHETPGTERVEEWLRDVGATATVERLHLAGFDHHDTDALLRELTGHEVPEEFTTTMQAVTSGNPLFIRELARHARSSGALDPRRDNWSVRVEGTPLPAGLRDVLLRRLLGLSSTSQELCRYVAISSDGIAFDVICAASELEQLTVLDALDHAVEDGVLVERQREGGDFVYEFSHALFRDVIIERITATRQASLHAALGAAMQHRAGTDEHWLAQLGYHLHSAGRLGNPPGAVDACSRAGELAMARTAYHDSATHFSRAVEACGWTIGANSGAIARLELRHAEALHRCGDRAGRQMLTERAFQRAVPCHDSTIMAQAALAHGGARSTYGLASSKTMEMLQVALRALDVTGSDDDELRAQTMSRLAQETYHIQRFDEAKTLSARALGLAPRGCGSVARAAVLDGRAWTLHSPDDLVERSRLADEMIVEAIRASAPEWEMMGRSWRCTALLELGRTTEIDEELSSLDRLAREAPAPSHVFRIATLRATRALMSGDFTNGLLLANATYEMGVRIEPENALQTLCAQLLGMFREQGTLVGLVDMAEQMVADFPLVAGWRSALAFVNYEAGRVDRAREIFEGLATFEFAAVPRDLAWMQAHSYLAELAHAFDDRRSAAILFRLLAPYSGRNVGLYDIASSGAVDHFLGLLATTLDRRPVAIRMLRRAVSLNENSGQRPAAARSQRALANQLRAGSAAERVEATMLVSSAWDTAAELGLTDLADRLADEHSARR